MKKSIVLALSAVLLVFNGAVFAVTAPNFQLANREGVVTSLSDYKGKVVLLDFWASWCVPCRHSFPWMNAMQAKYQAQGLEVVTINLDKERSELDRFLAKYPASFQVLVDAKGITPKQYKVMGMPTSYLIDAKGDVVARHIGFRQSDTAHYEEQIKQALAQ